MRQATIDDVLLLLGQATVEVAVLRARVAELEQQLAAQSPNGQAIEAEAEASA